MHKIIWFGDMRHEPGLVIVDSIDEKITMNPADADDYRESKGYDSYLIPDEYEGEIVFSFSYLQGASK